MAVAAAAPAKAKAMAVAADASAPTAKAKSKGAGKGRGRGLKRPAASTPPPAEDTGAPEAEGVEPAPAAIGKHRRISVPDGVKLGCSKCKWAEIGCTTCRPKAGLVESSKGVDLQTGPDVKPLTRFRWAVACCSKIGVALERSVEVLQLQVI